MMIKPRSATTPYNKRGTMPLKVYIKGKIIKITLNFLLVHKNIPNVNMAIGQGAIPNIG